MVRRALLIALAVSFALLPSRANAQASDSARTPARSATFAPPGCADLLLPLRLAANTVGPGLDLSDLDRSVSPCADFYLFASGGWIKRNPIPAAYPSWGPSEELEQSNKEILHQILEQASKDKNAALGSNWQKIGDFYASCMNESAVEAAGVKPLDSELERIADIRDTAALESEIARLQRQGVNALFDFNSDQDYKNSAQVIAEINQGGLGLPDRDYYTRQDAKSRQLRAAYLQHVENMFKLLGDKDATAAAEAKTVMEIETTLAKASMTDVELRDPDNVYHKMKVGQLEQITPHFRWADYFSEVGSPSVSSLNVSQPDFIKAADSAIASLPLADWKVYLRWHLLHTAAPSLSSQFVNEDFNFYHRTLTGTKEILPRWRRCVDATDRNLGEALGQYYVKRAFPPAAKAKATQMVENIIAALRDDLQTIDWMAPATRQKAIAKLNAIMIKVGYPNHWRDYSAFKVARAPYAENAMHGREFAVAYDLGKIGKPVNRGEWDMTPPTVNAYYNPSLNEIVFPAGILQPPFYDSNRDDALNYGEIGAAIGHEMTHGFDDEGAKFDAQGNLKNWWTPEDLKNFEARGECIAKQFDEFEVEPGLHENGKLEEGESIADLGGLVMAYAAYHKSLAGKTAPMLDGFTGDQRFFIAYAQSWIDEIRPEFARLMANSNEHPLGQFRANGPLANMPEFQKAFACGADSAMVRAEPKRCRIW